MEKKNILKVWPELAKYDQALVEAIHDDYEGFRIVLKTQEDSNYIKIVFKDKMSYRNTDESFLLKLWEENMNDDSLGKTFYIIESSTYVDFLNEMTFNMYLDSGVKHFAIYTDSVCIDILTITNPIIEFLG